MGSDYEKYLTTYKKTNERMVKRLGKNWLICFTFFLKNLTKAEILKKTIFIFITVTLQILSFRLPLKTADF